MLLDSSESKAVLEMASSLPLPFANSITKADDIVAVDLQQPLWESIS